MMGKKWTSKGLEGLLDIINDGISTWVASAIDNCEAKYSAKRVLLRALYQEYKEREKEIWHWKDWYRDLITDEAEKGEDK